ncbi:MAG: ComEC/Rec2 family competence protein, partial [Candidatus Paceibacterota bacterium]
GVVITEPDIRENNQKITVEIREGVEKTKILVSIGLEHYLYYGDEVTLSGKLEKPENFLIGDDGERYFDYVSYLKKDEIFYTMSYPSIEVLSSNNASKFKSALFNIKNKFLNVINISIPKPESILLGGLILGERSGFSEEVRENLINTGTIHIVALSGYNVTIVAEWIIKIFREIFFFLPRYASTSAGVVGIILFVIISGGGSTAIRAGVMAILALLARLTGRTYTAGRGLLLAGVLMVFFNPFVLVFDVSFQLSFLATFGVIFLVPRYEKYFKWIRWKWLADIVCTTTVVYLFVLPFILYKMGNLSLVAIPANILILPFIPITMGLGFMTGLLGNLSVYLSAPFAKLSYFLLHYELSVVNIFAMVPFATHSIQTFSPILVLVFYVLVVSFSFRGFFSKVHS